MTEQANQPTLVLRVRDPQFREIYANSSQTHVGPFDISLLFQKSSEIAPGQMGATDLVNVTLSPQHFKAFVSSVSVTLAAYESTFGKLSIAETDTAPLRSAEEISSALEKSRAESKAAMSASFSPSSTEPKPRVKRSRGGAQE